MTYEDYKKMYSSDTGQPVDPNVQSVKSTQAQSNNALSTNSASASTLTPSGYDVNSTPGKLETTQAKMDELYSQIMGYGKFSYDQSKDNLYQMYRDQYIANGQKSMKDTMGQAAGLTGGYGSTYAESAAQQSYNNYMQQLNSMIPTLEENAYSRWSNGLSNLQNQYSTTGNYYSELYAKQQADRERLIEGLNKKIYPGYAAMVDAGFSEAEITYWCKKLGIKNPK